MFTCSLLSDSFLYLVPSSSKDEKTNIAQTMTALMELKEKGAIRNIGVSNFSLAQIEQAEAYGEIDVVQPPYSMVNRSFGDLMQACHAKGIDSMTYASLGAGILTGAYRSMPDFAKDDLRWSFYDFYREPKFSKIMDFLSVMDKIASAHHATVAQVAINWSTQKAFVGTALCCVRNVKQAEDNCAAFTWELSADEMRLLDDELDKRGI